MSATTSQSASHPVLTRHIPALDGLRGIAILLVLMLHYSIIETPQGIAERLVRLGSSVGWVGVDLFFVLSGFLITGILFRARGTEGYFTTFYARRSLRIFPLYYVAVLVLFVVLPLLYPADATLTHLASIQGWYWMYLANVHTTLHHFPQGELVGHFWSLAVEEQFYPVWPLVVFLLSRRQLLAACGAMIAGAVVFRIGLILAGYEVGAFVLTMARMDALAVGAFVALVMHDEAGYRRLRRWAGPAVAALAGLCAALFFWRRGLLQLDPAVQIIGYTALAGLFGALLVLAVGARPGSRLHRALTTSGLLTLGKYSYAIYVIHQPVVALLKRSPFVAPDRLFELVGSQLLTQVLFTGINLAVTMGAAVLSWHLIEKHFLKLKDRFRPAVRVA